MKAVSLFSGAGGFEIGFERAGIHTVLQAESDPWCLSVLERHWRGVERLTDVRQVDAAALQGRCRNVVSVGANSDADWLRDARGRGSHAAGVDLVYGGFPCQDVSVAGNRAGLGGAHSGLWSEFHRVLSELRPRWAVIENVPGLISICSCAACVLIGRRIQRHNQRRKREKRAGICRCIACVAGAALRRAHRGRDFAHILLGLEELGFGWAYAILDARYFGVPQRRRRVFIVGCLGNSAAAAQVLAVCESCGGHPQAGRDTGQGVAFYLSASVRGTGDGHGNAWNSNYLAASRTSGGHPDSNMPGRHKEDDVNLVVAQPLTTHHRGIREGWNSTFVQPEARALTARASGYRMDGETETFIIDGQNDAVVDEVGALSTGAADNLIAFDWQSSQSSREYIVRSGDYAGANRVSRVDAISNSQGVRRLTPMECERLMGWPDGWTQYTAEGKEISDSHRYRMCGNGVVATVAEWIGHRIVAVNRLLEAA